MSGININSQDVIFALDIGTRSVIGTAGVLKDKKFYVVAEAFKEHEERSMIDGQIHDIGLVASAVNTVKKKLEEDLNMKLDRVSIAAAGRFLRTVTAKAELKMDYDREIDKDTIRSLELTAVKVAEQQINNQTEGKLYCVGYSVKNYFLNGYVINNLLAHRGEEISAEIIATFLPRSVVDSLYAVMDKVGLQVASITLEPIAAMEAAIPKNLRLLNIALVDIGAGTSDIAISSQDSISAYGMVPLAGDEVTEAIVKNYLVDFNTADRIKRECNDKETISYMDILGLENTVTSEEVIKLITPVVRKIADEIGDTIVKLNGDKSPNAIFMVGGGAYTPKLKEFLAEKINIPIQRIGIRGRDAVANCECEDNSLGSIGVTVLGIALVSIEKLGHDFIDVTVNGTVISLFNSYKHTVMDVMMQAGIDPKILIGKNGKSIRFNLNGIKRIAFGTLATNAEIKINDITKSIDEEVKEGDIIEIIYAKDGESPSPKVKDYVQKLFSVSFFMNDIIESLEPVAIINDKRVNLEENIKEGDEVKIVFPNTLRDYKEYFVNDSTEYKYFLNGEELSEDYAILEGDRIYRIENDEIEEDRIENKEEDENISLKECALDLDESVHEGSDAKDNQHSNKDEHIDKGENHSVPENTEELDNNNINKIEITVNDKPVVLKGKENYIFVDVFNYIEFDLTIPKGNLYLRLNGSKAGYYDKLKNEDRVEIGWE